MSTNEAQVDVGEASQASWLLRVEDVQKLLKISRSKIYVMLARGELPSVTIGGLRRIDRARLREWVDAQSA